MKPKLQAWGLIEKCLIFVFMYTWYFCKPELYQKSFSFMFDIFFKKNQLNSAKIKNAQFLNDKILYDTGDFDI